MESSKENSAAVSSNRTSSVVETPTSQGHERLEANSTNCGPRSAYSPPPMSNEHANLRSSSVNPEAAERSDFFKSKNAAHSSNRKRPSFRDKLLPAAKVNNGMENLPSKDGQPSKSSPRSASSTNSVASRFKDHFQFSSSKLKDFVVKTSATVASTANVQLSKFKQSAIDSTASAGVQLRKLKESAIDSTASAGVRLRKFKESARRSSIAIQGKLQLTKLKESLGKGKLHAGEIFNRPFKTQSVDDSRLRIDQALLPNHIQSWPRSNSLTQPKFMEERNAFNSNSPTTAVMLEYSRLSEGSVSRPPPIAPLLLTQNVPNQHALYSPAPSHVHNVMNVAEKSIETFNTTAKNIRKQSKDGSYLVERLSKDESDLQYDAYESVFNQHMPDLLTPQQQYNRVALNGLEGIAAQYEYIRSRPFDGTFDISRMDVHVGKNRYVDILCYDLTRVNLTPLDMDRHSYYINANFVNGYQQKRGYICCQGPLSGTCADFWRMIWQENVATIVMITKLVENRRAKCHEYWPQKEGKSRYGHLQIINRRVLHEPAWTVTRIVIKNIQTGEKKNLVHLLFSAWPDYGIPSSAQDYLQFIFAVKDYQATSVKELGKKWQGHPKGPPIVVHCSAGVGRTGSFIVSDICIDMIDNLQMLNIGKVLELVREQRALSIQTPEQYIFCHLALLEYAKQKGHIVNDMTLLAEEHA